MKDNKGFPYKQRSKKDLCPRCRNNYKLEYSKRCRVCYEIKTGSGRISQKTKE